MNFRKRKQGGVLVYVLIVSIAMVITLTSLLQAAGIEGYNLVEENNQISRYFAANSGLEVLRGMLYYDTRETFSGYLDQKADLEKKVLKYDGWNITFTIENNTTDDGWGGLSNDSDGIMQISSTAHSGDAFTSEGLRIQAQVMLLMTTKYSFASNSFGAAYMTGDSHWFGNVYWYAPKGALPNTLAGATLTFYGSFTSWVLPSSIQGQMTYTDNFTTHKAYLYNASAPCTSGYIYTYESGPLTPEEKFTDGDEFVPLPGITDLYGEFGDPATPDTIINASYSQEVNGYKTHYFADGKGMGAVSHEVLPDRVELFFHPDGTVWWRNCGEGPSDWRRKDIVQKNGTVIYVKQDAWIRGVINKRMVVAAGNDIFLNGNIRNSDFSQAHLLLISKDDIYFEVRKPYFNKDHFEMLNPLAEDKPSAIDPIDSLTSQYLAQRIFTDAEASQLAIDYPWLKSDIILWEGRPGALTTNTLFEASLMSTDRMVATTEYKLNSVYLFDNSGGRWEVKGTYFIGEIRLPPVDHVTNWTNAGGSAYYNEHPYAFATPPPYGGTINESYPIYRMDGSFWRMGLVNEGVK